MDKPEPDAVMAAPTELAYINSITRLTTERDELQAANERLKSELDTSRKLCIKRCGRVT